MRTLEYLLGPSAGAFLPGLVAGAAIALQAGVLSPLVVLKRLSFIGQGVSHAAFGGVGLAFALGLAGAPRFALIALFCLACALGISRVSGRSGERADAAIGAFLVGAMALGAALISWASRAGVSGGGGSGAGRAPAWEQILFGSILAVSWTDALLACASALATSAIVFLVRRPLLFATFDAQAAEAFGAPVAAMRTLLLALLAIAVVTAMKLAGVVLATALLILPGAAALRLSARLSTVVGASIGFALLAIALGAVGSFEADLPPGACMVGALIALLIASNVAARARAA